MCKFCYKLGENRDKKIVWEVRSCMADQNLDSENGLPSEWDNKNRNVSKEYFQMEGYRAEKGVRMSIEYRLETDDGLIINPFSEAIRFSFCPFCGDKLSEKIGVPEYDHQFHIEDFIYDLDSQLGNIE